MHTHLFNDQITVLGNQGFDSGDARIVSHTPNDPTEVNFEVVIPAQVALFIAAEFIRTKLHDDFESYLNSDSNADGDIERRLAAIGWTEQHIEDMVTEELLVNGCNVPYHRLGL